MMSTAPLQFALFNEDNLSTQSTFCSIIHKVISLCISEARARRVCFPNKTKWHNGMMELSWLYLIEFDQILARCLSNLPSALQSHSQGDRGRPINFEAYAAAPFALCMRQGLEHLQMACHFLLPSITMAICCTHYRGEDEGKQSAGKSTQTGTHTYQKLHSHCKPTQGDLYESESEKKKPAVAYFSLSPFKTHLFPQLLPHTTTTEGSPVVFPKSFEKF